MSIKRVKSYKIFFDSKVKTRVLTKSKLKVINEISKYFKSATNFIYKTNHDGYNSWKGMKKDDYNFVRKHYESEFNQKVTAAYSQNLYKFANDKYNDTKKAYFSKFTQNKINLKNSKLKSRGISPKKNFFKKPYSEEFLEFPLDKRMLKGKGKKALIKDEKVTNLYWLSILNPFKNSTYKKNINIPLKLYPEILEMFNNGYKYSFAIHNDYVKVTFSYEINEEIEFKKESTKLEKVAIDFGKYISSFDGFKEEQHDLTKMYNKINKLLKRSGELQKSLQLLIDSREFNEDYKSLKSDIKVIYRRIKAIRKSTYGQLKNYYSNNYKTVILEDLTFTQIEKKTTNNALNKAYKGRKFNKILRIMGRGEWQKIFENLVGNQLEKVNPKFSSQKCSLCGEISSKYRRQRQFNCGSCGHIGDADINASKNLFQDHSNILNLTHC